MSQLNNHVIEDNNTSIIAQQFYCETPVTPTPTTHPSISCPEVTLNPTASLAPLLLLPQLERARRAEVHFGFSAKLQKSMKCVCMFLSASGDVEVGLRGPRKLGEPTRSATEKVRFFPN